MRYLGIKAICIIIVLTTCYFLPSLSKPRFVVPPIPAPGSKTTLIPSVKTDIIPPDCASEIHNQHIHQKFPDFKGNPQELMDVSTPSVHASTITQLPGGNLILAWFGGTREGSSDVKIYASRTDENGNWSLPHVLLDRFALQSQTGRYIRKLGNPLLFYYNGRLHFFVVSVSFGGWSGSSLNHAWSTDEGKTWTKFKRMQISPLFNISSLVRCPPVALADGCLGLPIYHELFYKYGEWLVLNEAGSIIDKARIHFDTRALQPTVAVINQNEAIALLRNGHQGGGYVKSVKTTDAGYRWTQMPDAPILNPDSCIALLKLADGTLLLAGNPIEGRSILCLWKTHVVDQNEWVLAAELENEPGQEFSYPTLIQDQAGRVHIVYTWKRKSIRHRILPESVWNNSQNQPVVQKGEQ